MVQPPTSTLLHAFITCPMMGWYQHQGVAKKRPPNMKILALFINGLDVYFLIPFVLFFALWLPK